MQHYKAWWLTKDKNFGDLLTPYVLDYFQIPYQKVKKHKDADIMCVGSIARRTQSHHIVLGSGIYYKDDKINPHAEWKFVRGPYTRKRVIELGGKCPEIYGDPALLLPAFCKESDKEFDVGIVPHFVDYQTVKKKYPNYKIINVVNKNPLEVAKEITKCKRIVSSSLHGIICAHAYNIPAAWVKFSKNLIGDDIKFYDHYASIGIDLVQSPMDKLHFQIGSIDLSPIVKIFKDLKNDFC